ncbi:MAG: DUF433 domain-containing protein [Dehalococcoidia bacterium]
MAATVEIGSFISQRPDFWEGWPHITGTGVTVASIGILRNEGRSAEQIAHDYSLSLEQVYAALAHYFANRAAIDAQVEAYDAETDRIAEQAKATNGSSLR